MQISNSNLRFIKNYLKNKVYDKEQELIGDEFDITKRQAPLKTFNKVNKEKNKNYKYSWEEHSKRIYQILNHQKAIETEGIVQEINDFEDSEWRTKYSESEVLC